MAQPDAKLRLFTDAALAPGATIVLEDAQAHYVLHVMRARVGEQVLLFNGSDGEWQARIAGVTKRKATLICETERRAQADVPDIWLAFAPIKKTPADYVAQKATEQRPALKVLYTTGLSITDGMKAMFVESSAFLPKPYTIDQLQTILSVKFGIKPRAT